MPASMLPSVSVPRVFRHRVTILLLAASLAGVAHPVVGASFPPEYRFRSLRGARATIHFHQGLEPMAREAVAMADEILAGYETRYGYSMGRVQLVLADNEDEPNGFTSPLPYPMVHLRAAAPDGSDEFGNLESWLRLLLTHELAHSVHLDQARGIIKLGRRVFGRAPFLFPNAVTPQWLIEGLATYEETEGTAFGRGRNPDSLMVRRMAALANEYPSEDRVTSGLDRWPLGQAPYLFGEGFVRDLSMRFGEDTLPKVARVHSAWPLPFFDELTGYRVTGAGFHHRWREFVRAEKEQFTAEADRLRARGLTPTRPLTTRGIRQVGPRVSPDGSLVAFTSGHLARRRAIHVLSRADGRERRLVERNSGTSLSWTPDGTQLVYDEVDVNRLFANRSDLHVVDVATGRRRRLTRGLRARDPEVSPDGGTVAFVRRYADRSELALIDIDGGEVRDLTRSEPGVQWSGPSWHPRGDALVASRWSPGGWSDLVRIEPGTGAIEELTHDRAREVEPTWTPDEAFIVFRSDRDGVSNVYARRESDGTLLRVTNVLGGAFSPAVAPDGALVFSSYDAAGYDVHEAPIDWSALPTADPFADRYPAPRPDVTPIGGETKPYRPWPYLWPRFWAPLVVSGRDLRLGAATGGADPLLRHAWGVQAYRGHDSRRFGGSGFYFYDRFRPNLLVAFQDDVDSDGGNVARTRELTLRVSLPVARSRRSSQQVSVAWRRSHEEPLRGLLQAIDLGGLELAWTWTRDVQQYPYSISPSQGERFRVAMVKEDTALGSEVSLVKATIDARAYRRVIGDTDVLALRVGGGSTFGRRQFTRSFVVGGFPDSSLFDIVRTNHSILRGYPDDLFSGRHFVHGNVEYRFPLAHPQRGIWSLPVFVRHLHAAVFADAAHAWTEPIHWRDVNTSAGAALGADVFLGHALPVTGTVGVARGFAAEGDTRAYFRVGLAF
jgi:hypothetical protein